MFHKLSFIILVFSYLNCYPQEKQTDSLRTLRPEIKRLAQGIAKDNELKSEGVGEAGIRTEQWGRYESLSQNATTEELIVLTDYSNAVVRCYAFQALLNRQNVDHFNVLLHHLYDTAMVQTFQGCIKSSEMAGDYFIDVSTPPFFIRGENKVYIDNKDVYTLSWRQKHTLDSILIYDPKIILEAKYSLLRNLPPTDSYYSRIREIASKEHSPNATLALSRYKNPADTGIIMVLFDNEKTEYYAAYCAREFPYSSFYALLVKIFEKEWAEAYYDYPKWRILYQALSRYPTEQTYGLFKRTVDCEEESRRQTLGTYLMIAITKYPNQLYDPLKSKIKLDKFHLKEVEQQLNYEE